MKIKKRITIVADILVDEDFDTDACLCICELIDTVQTDIEIYVGRSENFEVLDYISQETVDLEDKKDLCDVCKKCGENTCGNDTLNHACFERIKNET